MGYNGYRETKRKNMARSIIKESDLIRSCIKNRMEEIKLSLSNLSRDAKKRGVNISIQSLSKYLKKSEANNLTEEQIVWICTRYLIPITLVVGKAELTEGILNFKLEPYSEDKAIKMLVDRYGERMRPTSKRKTKTI